MLCEKCGLLLEESAGWCPDCGTITEVGRQIEANTPKPSGMPRGLIIAIIVASVVLVGKAIAVGLMVAFA